MTWRPSTGLVVLILAWHRLGTLLPGLATHLPTLPTLPGHLPQLNPLRHGPHFIREGDQTVPERWGMSDIIISAP